MQDFEEKMTNSICPKCGKANSEDSFFCNYCGTKIIDEKAETKKEQQNVFGSDHTSKEDIDRDFLLTNIQNVQNLHFLSRNLDENISSLNAKMDKLGIKKELKEPVEPGKFKIPCPPKKIALIDLGIIILGSFLWPLALAAVIIHTIYRIMENNKAKEMYDLRVKDYNERRRSYQQESKAAEEQYDREINIAIPNLTKAIDDLHAERNEASNLLDECYGINIIPSKYRNIYAITFIYDYLSTSKGTLRDALFACDLDKIQAQLENVIQNQASMICRLAKIEANSEKQVQQQERMIHHLKNIESNTYDTARAAELSAQYNSIIAHNSKVVAYCSAMTYIENSEIDKFDPYSPCTIQGFGLERFREYYKD